MDQEFEARSVASIAARTRSRSTSIGLMVSTVSRTVAEVKLERKHSDMMDSLCSKMRYPTEKNPGGFLYCQVTQRAHSPPALILDSDQANWSP